MKKGIGIKVKVSILTILAMGLLTAIIAWIGYTKFNANVLESYVKYAQTICECENSILEEYNIGDMVNTGVMGETYDLARRDLNRLKNDSDIMYIYALYFEDLNDIHSNHYIINGKNDEELNVGLPEEDIYSYLGEQCEPDGYDEVSLQMMRDCVVNKETNVLYNENYTPEYGRLVSCFRALLDSNGNAVGVVAADIDANKITRDLFDYLRTVIIAAVLITVIMISLFIMLINRSITQPVEHMANSTDEFVKLMDQNVEPEKLIYQKYDVKGHDEIYVLSEGVASLANGVKNYMANLRHVTAEKERIGAELSVATHIYIVILPCIFLPFSLRH